MARSCSVAASAMPMLCPSRNATRVLCGDGFADRGLAPRQCSPRRWANGGRVWEGAVWQLKPVRGQALRYALRSRSGGAEGFSYDREWAAQRHAAKLRSRSIATPGRASRLGFDSFSRVLCTPGATTSLRARPGRLAKRSRPGLLRDGNVVHLENQDMRDGRD